MYRVTMIPGDGIGPEVAEAAKKVIDYMGVEILWDVFNVGEAAWDEVFQSLEQNRIALKGPITTPVGKGFRSINVMLRKKYDLYVNIRPVISIPGIKTPFNGIDLVIFRENTEDLYAGIEFEEGSEDAKRLIEFVDALPKTRSGKIMRRVLKAQELGMDPGDVSTLEE